MTDGSADNMTGAKSTSSSIDPYTRNRNEAHQSPRDGAGGV